MFLAGDIGGTKTILALYEPDALGLRLIREASFPSQQHHSFEEIALAFLADGPATSLRAACFGVAGAVIDGRCQTTNLPWHMEESSLAQTLHVPRVKLLNDLEAMAFGMLHLPAEDLVVLNAGTEPRRQGNAAVIAAGTGLGEAILYWDGTRHHPLASEGGHGDFAPRTDQEIELLRFLRGRLGGHVSYERVLSGPGIYNLYGFLRDSGAYPEPDWLAEQLTRGDPSVSITQAALAGTAPLCVATLEMFSTIYGAEAGNLALTCVAVGGVFIGGGIAPKILPILTNGSFMTGFTDKGRFADLMQTLPVHVAKNPRTPLLGAAHFAWQLA